MGVNNRFWETQGVHRAVGNINPESATQGVRFSAGWTVLLAEVRALCAVSP
jgi:hypothetical protein